jgi:probable phosphoglycerate mutase
MIKKLYIVRHGQTELNKLGIIQGRGKDTDLNDEGREQAQAFFNAYQHVPFDKIYISALKRTQQSIQQFIDLGIPFEKLPGLDEMGWGILEGQPSTPETKGTLLHLMRDWVDGKLSEKIEGGESPLEVEERQRAAFNIIMSHPEEETVLICMHGRALRLLLCWLTNKPLSEMDTFPHQNLVLYVLEHDGHQFTITGFNQAGHLKN